MSVQASGLPKSAGATTAVGRKVIAALAHGELISDVVDANYVFGDKSRPYRFLARVRAALRAAVTRTRAPLVRAAFRAAAERWLAGRRRALECACFANARCDAAERPSCFSACLTARDRDRDGRRFVPDLPLATSREACRRVRASRTWWISSRTNSPACVVGDLPSRLSLRARSIVFRSGIRPPWSSRSARSCSPIVKEGGKLHATSAEIGPLPLTASCLTSQLEVRFPRYAIMTPRPLREVRAQRLPVASVPTRIQMIALAFRNRVVRELDSRLRPRRLEIDAHN